MRPTLILFLATCLTGFAETEEQLNKSFAVQPGGKIVVEVDFGAININTNASNEVTVDVFRRVVRSSKADEEAFMTDHPVSFEQDGNTVRISCRSKSKSHNWWRGNHRTEGKYTIRVPASFNAKLKTAGSDVTVNDLTGEVKAETSGGGLKFARLHGTLNGGTSGGGIHVTDCEGPQEVHTSGGGIDVARGSGSLAGETTGGPVTVRDFRGPARVGTSGGGITLENVTGKVDGSTTGGSISARFASPLSEEVKLETSGGDMTLRVPDNSAFDLDASTSGGSVNSQIPVSTTGKLHHSHLKGPVNGGGKMVLLRTSGGSIHVKKS